MSGDKTADGTPIQIGMTVYIRFGDEYPKPGRWRTRAMAVRFQKRTGKLVLDPLRGTRKAERMPAECFASRILARGLA